MDLGFTSGSLVKNSPPKAEGAGSIPGLGRCFGEENDNPLQYSCLGNPMNRGAWWATVHGGHKRVSHNLVTKQQQGLKLLDLHMLNYNMVVAIKASSRSQLLQLLPPHYSILYLFLYFYFKFIFTPTFALFIYLYLFLLINYVLCLHW